MASWSTRRKASYLIVIFGIVFLLLIMPLFFAFYNRPTCFDGKKNGDEKGVDCGGTCQLLCVSEAVDPHILWSRAFKTTPNIYSAVAYFENRNINSEAMAPYIFRIYNKNNVLIAEREGITFIPKNKIIAIFEPNIEIKEQVPYRATFDFKEQLAWRKNPKQDPNITVVNKSLTNADTKPRIDATIKNESLLPISNIEAVAIVYDNRENAIAASRTFIDRLEKDESAMVTFTWPSPFPAEGAIIEIISRMIPANL